MFGLLIKLEKRVLWSPLLVKANKRGMYKVRLVGIMVRGRLGEEARSLWQVLGSRKDGKGEKPWPQFWEIYLWRGTFVFPGDELSVQSADLIHCKGHSGLCSTGGTGATLVGWKGKRRLYGVCWPGIVLTVGRKREGRSLW